MSDPIISFEDVTFTYPTGEEPAISQIDLEIERGEYVAIMGLNGAGKTTLGLCINGVVPKMVGGTFVGRVVVDGVDVDDHPVREMSRTVGMVFDNPEFQLSQATVVDEVVLGLESQGVDPDQMDGVVAEVLDLVGLSGLEQRSPFGLSGGQQQRLAIAAVVAMSPSIIVLDEPTSNLDPIGKQEVFAMAARLNRERGMTVVVVEHEVEAMASHADRIVVMDGGRVVMSGPPAEVFAEVPRLRELGLRSTDCAEVVHDARAERGLAGAVPVGLDEAVPVVSEMAGVA